MPAIILSMLVAGNLMQAAPAASVCRVGKATEILISTSQTVSSKTAQPGDTFPIELSNSLVVDGRTVLPAGTRGVGQVIHASQQRGGKAGELIVAARYLDAGGAKLSLRGFRVVAVGQRTTTYIFAGGGIVVTALGGTDVEVPTGAMAFAKVAEDITLPCS